MAHVHEKIDFCAQVWIVFEDKVLLRKHEKYGSWFGPGGHIDLGEDPLMAAIREVKEEVGLDVEIPGYTPHVEGSAFTELPPPKFLNRHKITETHDHVCMEYFAVASTDTLVIPEGPENAECRWCTREEVEKLDMYPNAKRYALAALDALGTKPI